MNVEIIIFMQEKKNWLFWYARWASVEVTQITTIFSTFTMDILFLKRNNNKIKMKKNNPPPSSIQIYKDGHLPKRCRHILNPTNLMEFWSPIWSFQNIYAPNNIQSIEYDDIYCLEIFTKTTTNNRRIFLIKTLITLNIVTNLHCWI